MDLCFLVDTSGSICDLSPGFNFNTDTTCLNWMQIVWFIGNITKNLQIGSNAARVALVTFGDTGKLIWNLDRYVAA